MFCPIFNRLHIGCFLLFGIEQKESGLYFHFHDFSQKATRYPTTISLLMKRPMTPERRNDFDFSIIAYGHMDAFQLNLYRKMRGQREPEFNFAIGTQI